MFKAVFSLVINVETSVLYYWKIRHLAENIDNMDM